MKTILLVDDNDLIINMLSMQLQSDLKDINLLTSTTYKEAVKFILDKNITIHLAILDIHLPDAPDGKVIKYATSKGIPTIAITASLDENTKNTIMKYNILDYVTKNSIAALKHVTNSANRILNNYDTNILIVDDSILQLKIAYDMLKKLKLNVTTAKDGKEAYEIIEKNENNFSLVLTDYNMPNMDGMELILKLREKYHKGQLGIIVLTTSRKIDIATQFLQIGANDFINKPYSQAEVAIRVNSNLDILELFKKERENSNRDFLTKAYNRRYFFESGNSILLKAKRENRNLAVVMIDIDEFKNINDSYGHDIGDIVIKETVNILNNNLRNSDLMARFGGEEFCILLENISLENLKKLLEKIRLTFEKNIIKTLGYDITYTVSIGVCYGIENNLDEMIKKADDKLYECKNNGKNQIAIDCI